MESQTDSPDSAACPGDVMACSVVCKLTHLFDAAAEDGDIAKRDRKQERSTVPVIHLHAPLL